MDPLRRFTIPIKGLSLGIHPFEFEITKSFFSHFEDSPIDNGKFKVVIDLDKRIDMMVLDFHIVGSFNTACDRCLEKFDLPINRDHNLIVKITSEMQDDDEVIYITDAQTELNLAKYIYEFIILSIPIVKVTDDENIHTCNEEVWNFLEKNEEEKDSRSNPIWDQLKGFIEN